MVPESYKGGDEQRLLPFKSNGRFCVPLYDLQAGVHKLRYEDITPSTGGRYWINMLDPDLMQRLHDPDWQRTHGDLGMLEVGDGLSGLYTTATAISLEDSANITLHGVVSMWPRAVPPKAAAMGRISGRIATSVRAPASSQWKGADGHLCRSTRYGTTMDHVTIRHTADDLQNFHGIWGQVKAVSGRQVTLETNPSLPPDPHQCPSW